MTTIIAIIATSYLLGSIPTSIIVGRIHSGIDIREHGSGNAGGTNVFRVLGWKPGVFVMVVDMGKGFVATMFVSRLQLDGVALDPEVLQLIAGFSAIVGHIWTVFAEFRGGKGVGAAAGMLLALYPMAFGICLAVFASVVFMTRIVSVASMCAAIALPIVLFVLQAVFSRPVSPLLSGFSIFVSLLIIFTHRTNIRRLLAGVENRFGENKAE